jgi:hypothetical protein
MQQDEWPDKLNDAMKNVETGLSDEFKIQYDYRNEMRGKNLEKAREEIKKALLKLHNLAFSAHKVEADPLTCEQAREFYYRNWYKIKRTREEIEESRESMRELCKESGDLEHLEILEKQWAEEDALKK